MDYIRWEGNMARGRKKKDSPGIAQKISGPYLVRFTDEKKEVIYFAGIPWSEIVELHKNAKVKFLAIETIATEFYRPRDITKEALKKLAGGKNG
jgi:hypothetical protein